MIDWSSVFGEAHSYTAFLDKYATPAQRPRWDVMHERISLTPSQIEVLQGFKRRLPVLVLTGAWCGDCINQVPIFDHFAKYASTLDLRLIDRDARTDVAEALSINGGKRVPSVLFLSEDYAEVARYGERTLATYRKLASEQLGAACPTGIVPPSDAHTAAVVQEWLDQFERAHLILRLSPRLREKHGD